jgi:hypothetical protein
MMSAKARYIVKGTINVVTSLALLLLIVLIGYALYHGHKCNVQCQAAGYAHGTGIGIPNDIPMCRCETWTEIPEE